MDLAALQFALKMLETPSERLRELVDDWLAEHPNIKLAELASAERDPFDDEELAEEADGGPRAFAFLDAPPPSLPLDSFRGPHGCDVWIFDNPPEVRANGLAVPRFRASPDDVDGRWVVSGIRARSKTCVNVVSAIQKLRPQLATASDPKQVASVTASEIGEEVGCHESTVTRVVSVCRFQNVHGAFGFTLANKTITLRAL
jgi:DNA-directed RNA polymerase specialized sigma54-like protein